MATSILAGILSIFARPKPAPMPAAFRSGRAAPVFRAAPSPSPAVTAPPHHDKFLLIEFGTTPDAKRFKSVVQDVLTSTIEGCAAWTTAHKKENGRAVIVHFRGQHYAPQVAQSAFDVFVGALDIHAMNNGSVRVNLEYGAHFGREWAGNTWREIVTPSGSDGKIMGFVLGSRIGQQIL